MEDEVWVTREGKEIKVRDMEISHVRNALNYMWRNSDHPCNAGDLSDEDARNALRDVIQGRDEEMSTISENQFNIY